MIIEFQQRIRDLQGKLDSVGSCEVKYSTLPCRGGGMGRGLVTMQMW